MKERGSEQLGRSFSLTGAPLHSYCVITGCVNALLICSWVHCNIIKPPNHNLVREIYIYIYCARGYMTCD